MKLEKFQQIDQLCESILLESSTIINFLKEFRGGETVAKEMHKQWGIPNDLKFIEVYDINLLHFLNTDQSGVIIEATKNDGVGALNFVAGRDGYYYIFSDGEHVQSDIWTERTEEDYSYHFPEFVDDLRNVAPVKWYISVTSSARDKKDNRRLRNNMQMQVALTGDDIYEKIKPIIKTIVKKAIPGIRSKAIQLLNNNALEKSRLQIQHLIQLQNLLDDDSDNNFDRNSIIKPRLHYAISLAGEYYYPNENTLDRERLIYFDIAAGDTSKLLTIVKFFKQGLLRSANHYWNRRNS
jgi:hypothetical protein